MLMRTGAGGETVIVVRGYRPERQRGFALALTALVFCLPPLCIALLSWHTVTQGAPAAPHVATFDVADPAPQHDEPVLQEQEVSEKSPPVPQAVPESTPRPLVALQSPVSPKPAPSQLPKVAAAVLPESAPPPAQKPRPGGRSEAPETWHARVLARLNASKIYPSSARARRQQGAVWVSFTVNRQGQVLSVTLKESSGFALLDREALALPKRTSPLPAPPDDVVGREIELTVPVEFYF
ncbi:energy transducer TonB [Novosphingobium guangzhouense]|uniref:TonB C-terminal domain-containing protein n=1 Tax=Novosphingobium guangzhouense TaxID=1850347 RepID=A0A2K2FTW0_9SPHN|nr:energy transducer TonB [Novosphingobium guangzhouense]PNU02208.1 hypothetical protein A8V01_10080 [Novosphingobium guangzhouense]